MKTEDEDFDYSVFEQDQPEERDEDINDLCPHCNGSGEGQHIGTTCTSCKGSGIDGLIKQRKRK